MRQQQTVDRPRFVPVEELANSVQCHYPWSALLDYFVRDRTLQSTYDREVCYSLARSRKRLNNISVQVE
jgi:hypothetical protein